MGPTLQNQNKGVCKNSKYCNLIFFLILYTEDSLFYSNPKEFLRISCSFSGATFLDFSVSLLQLSCNFLKLYLCSLEFPRVSLKIPCPYRKANLICKYLSPLKLQNISFCARNLLMDLTFQQKNLYVVRKSIFLHDT